ncbi:MAG: sulfite exporter TauE/SafE family protein [Alphaproteobacteria bacterium]
MLFAAFTPTPEQLLIVFFVTLIGDIFAAAVGGGGFLVHPVLLALGIPGPIALANDMAASAGAAASGAYVFHRRKLVDYRQLAWWMPGLLLGPVAGAWLLVYVPAWLLRDMVVINALAGGLLLAIFSFDKVPSEDSPLPRWWRGYALFFGFLVGIYFGFGGAGAGVLASAILIGVMNRGLRHTIGLKNIICFVPGLTACASYMAQQLIAPTLFLTMLAASVSGGYIGSRLIVGVSEQTLKKIFLACIAIVAVLMLATR